MARSSHHADTTTIDESSLDYVLNFQRHEWKYFMPKQRIEAIIPDLLRFMHFDEYNQKINGYYNLYSIYYDTEDWQSFHEKLDGIERRKKFRIRAYNAENKPDDSVFLEIKEKNKDIILKRRTPIKIKDIKKIEAGFPPQIDDPVYNEWRYNVVRNCLRPKILVAYQRLAFVPKDQSDVRITIDRNVGWSMLSSGSAFNSPLKDAFFSKTATILEVKFRSNPPQFVIDLVRRHNLQNEAISKYTNSVITNYALFK